MTPPQLPKEANKLKVAEAKTATQGTADTQGTKTRILPAFKAQIPRVFPKSVVFTNFKLRFVFLVYLGNQKQFAMGTGVETIAWA